MHLNTIGEIKGYCPAKEILEFIREHIDESAEMKIREKTYTSSELNGRYTIHRAKEDGSMFIRHGLIKFACNSVPQTIAYYYDSANQHENYDYFCRNDLREMAEAEKTNITLSYSDISLVLIRTIVKAMGGGWIFETDCEPDFEVV